MHRHRFFKVYTALTVLVVLAGTVQAQSWRLPADRKNTRHNSVDRFNIPRPALSIRGFDNSRSTPYSNAYSSTTYGVRQVLEKAYGINTSADISVQDVLNTIIARSDDSFLPWTNDNKRANAAILESRALIALLTFIIEENDGGSGEPLIFTAGVKTIIPTMPSHSTARNRLINALRARNNYNTDYGADNTWKNSTALMALARALDLYYALENAYEDLGGPLSNLLNSSDKFFWRSQLHAGIARIWQETNSDAKWYTGGSIDVQKHEVQQGNWALIGFVAAGYAVLGFNGSFPAITDDDHFPFTQNHGDILRKAMKSTAFHYSQTGDNAFYNYWWYQTGAGKRYWAEGAHYFESTLMRVIPFWHAIRANDMLSYGEGDGIDPFRYQPFLNSIEWFADIATPDGFTPPLDDGNKRQIQSAHMLRWSSTYGKASTGKKFVWISNENGGYGNSQEIRLIELAIPRTQTGTSPETFVGNTAGPYNNGEQQLILRRTSGGNTHYVLLNGEHGAAFKHGTGHEQPDNMQLLYYVNGTSVLMDSGYDSAGGKDNSTWNHYYDHNVLNFYFDEYEGYAGSPYILDKSYLYGEPPEGGMTPPFLTLTGKGKEISYLPISDLYATEHSNVTCTLKLLGEQLRGTG